MRNMRRMAALTMAAALAACGGGGGGETTSAITTPSTPATPTPDPNVAAAILSVGFYDMLAGPDRMLAQANALTQLAGPTPAAVTTACSTGTISTTKTSASSSTLVAANCHLSTVMVGYTLDC